MSTIALATKVRVTIDAIEMARDNGTLYQTKDKETASMVAMLGAEMSNADTQERIKCIADSLMESRNQFPVDVAIWTYYVCLANYFSWAWHKEGNDELSAAWACAWHDLRSYSLDNLKGDDLAYYIKTTD